jgi:hypothetical protein
MHTFTRAVAVLATALAVSLPVSGGAAEQATSTSKDMVAMNEARDLVLALPEVKAWQEERRKTAALDPKAPPTVGILTGTRSPQGRKHWSVTFYRDPSTQPEKWATFLVRARDGKVFIEGEDGKPIPLEQWRRTLEKPAS